MVDRLSETDVLPGGGVPKMLRGAVGAVGQQTVGVAGAAAGGVADVVGNPLTDVAEGSIGGLVGSSVTEGLAKQMNTMLIILGLAYVAGRQAGRGDCGGPIGQKRPPTACTPPEATPPEPTHAGGAAHTRLVP
jgi:hypothetical protein